MSEHGQQLVGGEGSLESRAEPFTAFRPDTGQPLEPTYYGASAGEVARACALAAEARTPLARVEPQRRAAFLESVADAIETLGEPLLRAAHDETGLGLPRLTGERGRTCAQLRRFATLVREGSWVEARIDRGPDVRRMLVPLGPVAVFGASNFPLAFSVAGGDTASALAAGCPVVCKAHPAHPTTSALVAGAIAATVARHDLPPGTFSLLHGPSPRVGLDLVADPRVRAVGFTGSLRAGRAIFDAAQARPRPIPVYAEMGSTNPVFLLPERLAEDPAQLARDLHASVTLGVGQFCTNPGLVFTTPGADELVATLRRLTLDAPAGTMLHAGIREAYEEGVQRAAALPGVERHGAGFRADSHARGTPTLLVTDLATFLAEHDLSDEIFGPVTVVVRCPDSASFSTAARALPGQLTATVHGTPGELSNHTELLALLADRAGRLVCNAFPTGVAVCAAMHHGGPYPATTDARSTSVGTAAIQRFARPVCYQGFPAELLPPQLRDDNPEGILRLVDDLWTRDPTPGGVSP